MKDKVDPYSADDIVELDGMRIRIRDIESAGLRASFGVGHFYRHTRPVIAIPGRTFPFTPDTCLVDMHEGEALSDGSVICTGCGLDCT
jgi:hypothetical protein